MHIPPEIRADLLQDRVHTDAGPARAAVAHRLRIEAPRSHVAEIGYKTCLKMTDHKWQDVVYVGPITTYWCLG